MSFLMMWVVYRSPKDYPGKWVVRRQWASRNEIHCCADPEIVTDDLRKARSVIPFGLYNLGRMQGDDKCIYEVWM